MASLAPSSSWASAKSALASTLLWLRRSWLGRTALVLIRERQARLATEELRNWDDRMLRDVGLERMEIAHAVRGRFHSLPRHVEAGSKPQPVS